MLTWIIQITIISFIFIFLVHHLFQFFRDTLTVPKFKDLVNTPNKKYENIYEILSKQDNHNKNNNTRNTINDSYSTTDIHLLPMMQETTQSSINSSMKDELKNFLKSQLQPNDKGEQSFYQFK
jgi:hypothetical protein